MAPVRGDIEPVAGAQQARLGLVGEPQLGGAGDHQHPFAFRPVIPEPRRARLTQRDDPLDPEARPGQQCRDLFGCPRVREWREEVHGTPASYAGVPRRTISKYIIVDMYAKAVQGIKAADAVSWATGELQKIYGA